PSSNLIALMRMRRGGCSRPCFHRYSFNTSSMKIRSGLRCCFTCSRIALTARGVRSVRLAAHALRRGTTMIRSSSCSPMASRLQLGIGELDAPESFPRLRRQDLPQDRLPLGLDLFAVLLLRRGLPLNLLELGELLPANRLEFVVVHRHPVRRLLHTWRVPDSS